MDPDQYRVEDMTRVDLDDIAWSGNPLHITAVVEALDRRDRGEVDYLVVRDRDGSPVAKTGLDFTAVAGAGTIWQLATHAEHEGRGLATALIRECEARTAARGLATIRLGVEYDNERALGLYKYLGYVQTGEEPDGWDYQDTDGSIRHYETVCAVLEKRP